jgi:hypothetical protein
VPAAAATFIKTDDSITKILITMFDKFTTTIQLKLGYSSDIFNLSVQSQETNVFFLGISCR